MDESRLFLSVKVFKSLQNPTKKQMKMSLKIHRFVVEKCDGRVKAGAVVDGRMQA